MSGGNYLLLIDAAKRGAGARVMSSAASANSRIAYYLWRPFTDVLAPVANRFRIG